MNRYVIVFIDEKGERQTFITASEWYNQRQAISIFILDTEKVLYTFKIKPK